MTYRTRNRRPLQGAITDKQRRYIADLCERAQVTLPDLSSCTRQQASDLITTLKRAASLRQYEQRSGRSPHTGDRVQPRRHTQPDAPQQPQPTQPDPEPAQPAQRSTSGLGLGALARQMMGETQPQAPNPPAEPEIAETAPPQSATAGRSPQPEGGSLQETAPAAPDRLALPAPEVDTIPAAAKRRPVDPVQLPDVITECTADLDTHNSDWALLQSFAGGKSKEFMFMYRAPVVVNGGDQPGCWLYHFKHHSTRRYLHLDDQRNAYRFIPEGSRYRRIYPAQDWQHFRNVFELTQQ